MINEREYVLTLQGLYKIDPFTIFWLRKVLIYRRILKLKINIEFVEYESCEFLDKLAFWNIM